MAHLKISKSKIKGIWSEQSILCLLALKLTSHNLLIKWSPWYEKKTLWLTRFANNNKYKEQEQWQIIYIDTHTVSSLHQLIFVHIFCIR